jgi:DNA-binding MarR family transcriptional regulator
MVELIDDLEDRGLVKRRRHPSDRRAHALTLTAKGKQLLTRAFTVAFSIEAELCADLEPADRQKLLVLLGQLRQMEEGAPGVHPGLSTS